MTEAVPKDAPPLVAMHDITVTFPGVKALSGVDFRLFPGEVHALMGENGAGKSTLIKALTGVHHLTRGSITLDGKPIQFRSTAEAQAAGIATVYQEVNLCANLSIAENVMLGHEVHRGPFVHWRATQARAAEYLQRLHLAVDPRAQLGSLTIASQQLCAIARALVLDAKVLILDEPTSSLDQQEVAELFDVIREIRDSGVAILFVSHFLNQVYEISDRMTVLRNGQLVGERMTADLPRRELISMMLGRSGEALAAIEGEARTRTEEDRETPLFLSARDVGRRGSVQPFSLDIRRSEVLGLAGLLGSGRTEVARLLCGADRADSGEVDVDGQKVTLADPLTALKHKIVYSTEDRKRDGIVGDLSIRENIALALQARRGVLRPLSRTELDAIVEKFMVALDVHPNNPDMLIRNLSGGNQQKVLLARWLATDPTLLILDEPTRGIDIGTKAEIQRLVTQLADDGRCVVFISSELEEVMRVANRVAVMCDRAKIGELENGPSVGVDAVLEEIGRASEVKTDAA